MEFDEDSKEFFLQLVIIAIILAIIFLFIRLVYFRLKEQKYWIKKSETKLEEIKNKIAYEMHQDIGNDLNALLFKIKNWHIKNGNHASHEFLQLENSTTQIINKVNDIVWSLKVDNDNLKSLTTFLIQYTDETLGSTKITYDFITPKNLPKIILEHDIKKNIHLFFKEALNNVIKHAEANDVKIEITYHRKTLKVTIVDNGKGFNLNEIIKGNGIESMQNRIKHLNGKLEFIANKPKGTLVNFEIKI